MINKKKTPISEWQIQCPDNVADTVVTAAHGKVYMKENGFFEQALQTLNNNECEPGDTINAFNQSVDKSGCCPTITTRPEGKKQLYYQLLKEKIKWQRSTESEN